jgi:hypothetical protein
LDSAITSKILFEIGQIDRLLSESSPLVNLCKVKEPDYVEKCGGAMILHSFYNGIESVLLLITKNKDVTVPKGVGWHKELLDNAFENTENRTRIFREELRDPLMDYLKFRHFIRHSYGFQLKWEDMKDKLLGMDTVWQEVKEDINTFIENN